MSLTNILPYALSKGDTIGIIAPASSVQELEVELGIASIEARGYRVQRGKYLYASHADNGYLAGEDALRIDDLHRMFEDPSINAIFFADYGQRRQTVTQHDLRNALDAVLAGKPVAQPVTEAIGCHIQTASETKSP